MNLQQLTEGMETVLSRLSTLAKADQTTAARFTAVLLVMRDMVKGLPMDDPLMKHTYVDYLYDSYDQVIKCLNLFYDRIQQSPRARTLYNRYETQMLDAGFGKQVIEYRLNQLAPFFRQMKTKRVKYHQTVKRAQQIAAAKKQKEDSKTIFDLSNADEIHSHLDNRGIA